MDTMAEFSIGEFWGLLNIGKDIWLDWICEEKD